MTSRRRLLRATLAALSAPAALAAPRLGRAAPHVLRFAFQSGPDHPNGVGARLLAERVAERSGGRLDVKLFPNGVLGGDVQTVSALQGGVIDMTVISSGILATQHRPFVLFDLPFQFVDGAQADAVVDGPIGTMLAEGLKPKQLELLAYWELGFRNLSNSRREVTRLDDFRGMKIRVIQSPIYIELFTALGANAVPMPFPEVYTALEQKAIDGQENPLKSIEESKLFEVQPFVTLTRHVYSPMSVLIGRRSLERLSPADRDVLVEAAQHVRVPQRRYAREQDAAALQLLRGRIRVSDLAPGELQRIRDRVAPVVAKFAKDVGDDTMNTYHRQLG